MRGDNERNLSAAIGKLNKLRGEEHPQATWTHQESSLGALGSCHTLPDLCRSNVHGKILRKLPHATLVAVIERK